MAAPSAPPAAPRPHRADHEQNRRRITSGANPAAGSAASRLATSKPSKSGSWMSSTTRPAGQCGPLASLPTGGRLGDREAGGLEHAPDKSPEAVMIVDNQDRRSWRHGSSPAPRPAAGIGANPHHFPGLPWTEVQGTARFGEPRKLLASAVLGLSHPGPNGRTTHASHRKVLPWDARRPSTRRPPRRTPQRNRPLSRTGWPRPARCGNRTTWITRKDAPDEYSTRPARSCQDGVRPAGCAVLSRRTRRPAHDSARLAAARLPVPVRARRAARSTFCGARHSALPEPGIPAAGAVDDPAGRRPAPPRPGCVRRPVHCPPGRALPGDHRRARRRADRPGGLRRTVWTWSPASPGRCRSP